MLKLTLMAPWRVLNAALTSASLRDLRRDQPSLSEGSESSISGIEPKALRTFFACAFSTERPRQPRLLLTPASGRRGSTR